MMLLTSLHRGLAPSIVMIAVSILSHGVAAQSTARAPVSSRSDANRIASLIVGRDRLRDADFAGWFEDLSGLVERGEGELIVIQKHLDIARPFATDLGREIRAFKSAGAAPALTAHRRAQ